MQKAGAETTSAFAPSSAPDVTSHLLWIGGPGLLAALALEHADGAALCRVQHCADQLRLSVAPATSALFYCLSSREVGRAEIVHRSVPLRATNADIELRFREFVLKVNIVWRCVELAESAKAVNSIGSSELVRKDMFVGIIRVLEPGGFLEGFGLLQARRYALRRHQRVDGLGVEVAIVGRAFRHDVAPGENRFTRKAAKSSRTQRK